VLRGRGAKRGELRRGACAGLDRRSQAYGAHPHPPGAARDLLHGSLFTAADPRGVMGTPRPGALGRWARVLVAQIFHVWWCVCWWRRQPRTWLCAGGPAVLLHVGCPSKSSQTRVTGCSTAALLRLLWSTSSTLLPSSCPVVRQPRCALSCRRRLLTSKCVLSREQGDRVAGLAPGGLHLSHCVTGMEGVSGSPSPGLGLSAFKMKSPRVRGWFIHTDMIRICTIPNVDLN
jgi:hypothetical protein